MSKKKPRKTQLPSANSGIKRTPIAPYKGLSFSYKFLQTDHQKFSIQNRDSIYLVALLERLRNLSALTALDLKTNRSASLRCHPIDWTDTSEICFDIPNEEQLVDTPYQFSVSSNEHGRVHGFFIEEVFYIVWLDPAHQLYS